MKLGSLDPRELLQLPDVHRHRAGRVLRARGWWSAELGGRPEAFVEFAADPSSILGFDGPLLSVVSLAEAWYRLKGRPGAGLGAFAAGRRVFVLVDRRWCERLGLAAQLWLRVSEASQAAAGSGTAVNRTIQEESPRSRTFT